LQAEIHSQASEARASTVGAGGTGIGSDSIGAAATGRIVGTDDTERGFRMNIIRAALRLAAKVTRFRQRAREFYYAVLLAEHRCPRCNQPLAMVRESWCRCRACGLGFDPTVAFQRCPSCGGPVHLRVCRYACAGCARDVPSRFQFDGLAYDAEYFRDKMAKHRQRRLQQRERVRQMLAESRSANIMVGAVDLGSVPGLVEALDELTVPALDGILFVPRSGFDLGQYQAHITAHLQEIPVELDKIPPLIEDRRLDRVWRFIAVIFLAHAGTLDVWQEGMIIKVIKHETHTEGQGVPGETEEPDRVARPVDRAAA
jgi:hypothetical protein